MPSPFDITVATNTVVLDNNRQGVATFTVHNNTRRRIHATAEVTTQPPDGAKWLTIAPPEGSTVANPRDFEIDATQQYQIKIAVPLDAPPASYTVKLTVADSVNPDDNFTESPDVLFTVREIPKPAPRPFPAWVVPAVLIGVLVIVLVIIGGVALSRRQQPTPTPTVLSSFNEDFSSDPNVSGKWHFYRLNADPTSEDFWDAGNQQLYLTTDASGRGAAAFANYQLTATRWQAQFRYNSSGADGFAFMFYKKESAYTSAGALPGVGGGLGFILNDNTSISGYGIEFDAWLNPQFADPYNNYVAIIKDTPANHFRPVPDARTGDSLWHNVVVRFDNGRVTVNLDSGLVIDYTLATPDYSFSGVGFSAGTGDASANHIIDDFVLQPL